jgi:hypothetical protein
MARKLRSCLCTQAQFESAMFRRWSERLRPAWDELRSGIWLLHHRKIWEWCFIAQALWERGMLRPGRRGLGFGVGQEPLTALFASFGCELVATDLDADGAKDRGWVDTKQHAANLDALNKDGICDPQQFRRLVTLRNVDMNAIPADLTGFDFTWSACSFEHLGSIEKGQDFIVNQTRCLRKGGVAVHTTEYNVESDDETVDHTNTVLFRRRDIEFIRLRLRTTRHKLDVDYDPGRGVADKHIDAPPFGNPHLKVRLGRFVTTSFGLIIEADALGLLRSLWRRRRIRIEYQSRYAA